MELSMENEICLMDAILTCSFFFPYSWFLQLWKIPFVLFCHLCPEWGIKSNAICKKKKKKRLSQLPPRILLSFRKKMTTWHFMSIIWQLQPLHIVYISWLNPVHSFHICKKKFILLQKHFNILWTKANTKHLSINNLELLPLRYYYF